AVESDDASLVIDGDENTRHITFLVLSRAKAEPIVQRSHAARKRRAVMLAERFDRLGHARSAEEFAMTLQRCNEARGGIGPAAERREEGVAIRARQHHALMLVEEPARALVGKIAGGKTGDRHGLLDHLLCRGCQPQFEPLRFVLSLRRCLLSRRGRHVSKCERFGRSLSILVRQFAVLGKNAARSAICGKAKYVYGVVPRGGIEPPTPAF